MKINLYFIRHGESISNKNRDIFNSNTNLIQKIHLFIKTIRYEPPLSLNGIKQSYKLKKKLKNINFDLIFCSNLIRSVMTGMFACDPNQELIISPFINEELNFLGNFDKSNKPNSPDILNKKIKYITRWLDNIHIKYPKVNLEFYNNYSNNYKDYNVNEFLKFLINIIKIKKINKDEVNICIFTHGNFIRHYIYPYFTGSKYTDNFHNTQIAFFSITPFSLENGTAKKLSFLP